MNAYYAATDSLFIYLGVAKYDSSIVSDYSIGQFLLYLLELLYQEPQT